MSMLRRFCAKGFFGISIFAILLSDVHHALAAEDTVPAELQQIVSLQRRADILAAGELGQDNYHLAKSRIWLDLALSEYHESEKNGIVPAAIEQASTLLNALEKKQTGISMDAPAHIPGSEPVRPDLWKKIASLKNSEKTTCGQRQIAEAEIYLVWAGHEKLEANWRNAKTYTRSAEASISEARAEIEKCAASLQPKKPLTVTEKSAPAVSAPSTAAERPRHIPSDLLPKASAAVPVAVAPIPVITAPASQADAPLPEVPAPAPAAEKPRHIASDPLPVASAAVPVSVAPTPVITAPASKADAPLPEVPTPAPAAEKPRHIASDLLPSASAAVPIAVAPTPVITAPASKADAPLPAVPPPAPVVKKPSLMSANQPVAIAPVPEVAFPSPAVATPAPAVVSAPPVNEAPATLIKDPPTEKQGSPHEIEKFMLSGTALFEFKKAVLDPSAQRHLRQLLKSIKNISMLDKVELIGHTDRWRRDGRHELNQLLSEQRAESVKRYLVHNKVPAARIHVSGVGSSQPIVECPADQSKEKQIACLQPNRRVEIILRGTRPGTTGRPENN